MALPLPGIKVLIDEEIRELFREIPEVDRLRSWFVDDMKYTPELAVFVHEWYDSLSPNKERTKRCRVCNYEVVLEHNLNPRPLLEHLEKDHGISYGS